MWFGAIFIRKTMSQYATVEQLLANSLTVAAFSRFIVDGYAAANAALQAASDEADTYMNEQLVLPLQTWGGKLVKVVCDIAAFNLYVQFGYNPNASGDKNYEARYDRAMDWLMAVSRKEIKLVNSPAYIDSSAGTPQAGPYAVSNAPVGFGQTGGVTNNDPRIGVLNSNWWWWT